MVKVTQLAGAKSISLFPSLSTDVPLPLPNLSSPQPLPPFRKAQWGWENAPGGIRSCTG